MEYILAAIICVLVVAFCITLYIMLNNIRRLVLMLICVVLWFYLIILTVISCSKIFIRFTW